jgi:hypothetical protein
MQEKKFSSLTELMKLLQHLGYFLERMAKRRPRKSPVLNYKSTDH